MTGHRGQMGVAAMLRAFGAMDDRIRSEVHGLARKRSARGEVGIQGYWPKENEEPLFRVYGDWMTAEDLRFIAEHAERIAK